MTPDLILGVDVGNTVVKAVLFDLQGHQVARHGIDGTTLRPEPGMVERPISELWLNACAAISGCLKQANVDAGRIASIGLAGHGNGLYLLDKRGSPLVGIQSLDSRAALLAKELDQRAGAALHAICLQKPWPSQTPVLLAWMKSYLPELFAQAGTLCFAKDIVGWHLTGKRYSEISDMSGAGLLRLPEAKYDSGLLALYGISDALPLLPELVQPTDVIGQVNASAADATGLRVGTPVVAGYFDVVASALGSGVVGPGAASIVLGTWSINQVFCEAPLRDPRVFMSSAFGQGRFSSMDNSATSAANLEWYVRTFLNHVGSHEEQFAMVNEWIGRDSFKPDDPMFHPFLYGGRNGPHQRGGFYGLASWHDQGHILRALCEGVCFEHRRHVDTLISAGAAVSAVHLSGGGCRSPHWPQMMANVLGNSVTLGSADETGALGAAIAAATGVSVYATEELSVSAMTRPRTHLQPNAQQQEVHSARFAAWTQLTSSLEPFWLELEELRRS